MSAKWDVTWRREDYHEMETGEYAWQYSQSVVHVTCSSCGRDSGSFVWSKKGKGESGLDGMAYKLQFERIAKLKTPYCAYCGKKMEATNDPKT